MLWGASRQQGGNGTPYPSQRAGDTDGADGEQTITSRAWLLEVGPTVAAGNRVVILVGYATVCA